MKIPKIIFEACLNGRKAGFPKKRLRVLERFEIDGKIDPQALVFSESKSRVKISFFTEKRSSLNALNRAFQKNPIPGTQFEIKLLRQEDWFDKWKRDYRPLSIPPFKIIPAWYKNKKVRQSQIPILLDPGAAFGSGCHETTELMLKMMGKLKGKFDSFLDVGTGTGILSVAAEKLGAQTISGFDLDPLSIEAARKNAKINQCRFTRFKVMRLEKFQSKEGFDLIAANLQSTLLLNHQKILFRLLKPGGHLLVSGILKRDVDLLIEGFRSPKIRLVRVLKGRHWVSILYQSPKTK